MWRSSMALGFVVTLGCGEGGQSPPDGSAPPVLETAPFTARLCVGGTPGEPTCPFNTVPLEALGVPGASLSFVLRPLMSGVILDDVELVAGPLGLHVEHPQFLLENMPLGDPYVDVVLDIAPEDTAMLESSQVALAQTSGSMVIRFDAIGPLAR